MLQREYTKVEELIAQLKTYVNTEIELAKLTVVQKISKVISDIISLVFVGLIFFLFLLFGSMALAYFLGEWFDKIWVGFLIVAVTYLALGIIAWSGRKSCFGCQL